MNQNQNQNNNSNKTVPNEWMKDPRVAHIDTFKLEFLQTLVFEGNKMSREQMMPFLMSVMKRGKENNVSFSDEEMDVIISVLKEHSSPEEIDKINKIMAMRKKKK